MNAKPAIFGIVGWKNSGKTTLVAKLVMELSARGLAVSTLKHAHHSAEIDQHGSDTHQHREAGATEVAIVTQNRWAIMHELRGDAPEPTMADTLARMSPCDIVLVEGYKNEAHRKIEVQRADANSTRSLWKSDPAVLAVVNPLEPLPAHLSQFGENDIAAIADFILETSGLSVPERAAS